ncbi:hypothetical protein CHS0354_023548, partial [Potamilus streckersoni]
MPAYIYIHAFCIVVVGIDFLTIKLSCFKKELKLFDNTVSQEGEERGIYDCTSVSRL